MTKELLNYFAGDELAASTWENKYALRDDMEELVETSPEEMHHRLAKEFWRVEKDFIDKAIIDRNKLSEYGQKRKDLNEETIFKLFDKFKYIVPAGSVMAGAGGDKPVSLSNCFVLPTMPKDSYTSIMMSRFEMVQLEKRRGGCIEENTNVIIRDRGIIPIREVNVGDFILSFNINTKKDEWKKVRDKYYTDVALEDQIAIKTTRGEVLRTSKKHPLLTIGDNGYSYKNYNSGSLSSSVLKVSEKFQSYSIPNDQNLIDIGWMIGMHFGDGTADKNYRIRMLGDEEVLVRDYTSIINRETNSNCNHHKSTRKGYKSDVWEVVIKNNRTEAFVKKFFDNTTGHKTYTWKVPTYVKDNNLMVPFLAGLIDSDGYITTSGRIDINTCSLSAAKEICEFLASVGEPYSLTQKEPRRSNEHTMWLIRIPNYSKLYGDLKNLMRHPKKVQRMDVERRSHSNSYFLNSEELDEIKTWSFLQFSKSDYKLYSLLLNNKRHALENRKAGFCSLNLFKENGYLSESKFNEILSRRFIQSIEEDNLEKKSYIDIEVEGNNNYYAGEFGFINIHNCGTDLSNLRPRGAFVNNAAKTSTGAASFMEGFSAINNEVAQGSRRGALMITLSIVHPDSPEFITVKQDLTKVTGANVSVKIPDDFMKAVEKNEDYLLHWPVQADHVPVLEVEMEYNVLYPSQYTTPDGTTGRGYVKKIHAKELWDTLIHCAWNTAEPGILFESTLHGYAPDGVYPKFKMVSTNPCQPLWATVISKNKGLTTLGEVGIGEEIWSSEGWTRIVNKQYTGKKDVYSIRTSGGVFYGTENHRVVSDGKKIEAGLCDSIDSLSGEVFNRESPIDPTVVMDGLVLGDGEVHKASNNLVLLDIGKDDYDYFKSDVASLIGKHRPGIHEYSYEVITNIRPEELISKTAIEIPERYMSEEKDRICDFLRGLYSANGSVVNNRITLKTASPKLRDQVQLLLSYLGIDSYYTTNKEKSVEFSNGTYTCNESYDINISTDRDKFVANIGFIQEYKNNKIDLNLSRPNRSKERLVVCKEYISTEDVFDITVNNSSHTYWTGGLNVSNCGEIPMGSGDSCRLIHVNLSSFVKNSYLPGAEVDWDKLYSVFYEATRLGDDLVTLEEEAVDRILNIVKTDDPEYAVWDKIKKTAREGRRSGVGFFGLSDMIAMLGIKFCSPESIEIVDKVCHKMMEAELDAEVDLAIERGMFPAWNKTYETADANRWYKFVSSEYPEQWERMQKHGRRNISFSTVAPTGTTSLISRASSGIEPVFMPFYMRRRKCNSDSERVDFVDKMGVKFQEFIVVHPGLEEWAKITYPGENIKDWKLDKWQEVFEKSPWYGSTSPEIDWEKRVELQGVVQKYITHAISSTVNLPNNVTEDEVSKIYMTAWKTGNKGQTIYRDGSRDGILVKAEEKRRDDKFRSYVEAPKRPKVLPADFYTTKVKGELFYVMVGLYLDKPYEIFVFKPDLSENEKPPKQHRGEITKIKRGVYTFKSDLLTIENISKDLSPLEGTVSRFSSMLLRSCVNPKYIIDVAQKSKDGINGFVTALIRILSKYLNEEVVTGETCPDCGHELTREGGCIICKNCGYSKCL